MHSMSDTLQFLARQMGMDNVTSRAELEAKLAPLLYLVVQTGQGHPSLLRWVRLALTEVVPALRLGGQVDPERTALHLTRRLCLQFLRDVRPQRDTIVNNAVLEQRRGVEPCIRHRTKAPSRT